MEYWNVGQNILLHYSNTPLLRGLAAASFPLTCGASVPTFYAFSGVETAGEQ